MLCYIPIMNEKNIAVERGHGLSLLSLLIFGLCNIQHSRTEEGLPPQVRRLAVEGITKSSVILKWAEPLDNEFSETLKYDVECYSCSSSKSADCEEKYERAKYNPGQHNLTTTNVTISNLKHGSKYKFKVYSKNMILKPSNVSWKFTEVYGSTREAETSQVNSNLAIIIGVTVLIVFFPLFILVLTIIVMKSRRICNVLNRGPISTRYADIDRIEHNSMAERNHVEDEVNEFPLEALAEGSKVQWRQTSTKNRLKFEELVKIAEKEPSAITVIGTYRVCFRPEFAIGYGSSGTVVYIGLSEDGIEIAVKSIPMHICKELGENEKEILNCPSVRKESHIVNYRFYTDSINSEHGYLVLDLHEESLKDYVLERSKEELTSDGARIIHEVLRSLKALHCGKEEILHRDLKPENILVSLHGEMVLSDFGISRKLRKGQTTHKSGEKGTDDWIAVESLLSDLEDDDDSSKKQAEKQVRYKKQSDIQVTGMLLFYILSKGGHPYGQHVYRKGNLFEGKPVNLGKLDDPVAKDLIGWMLQHDPKNRPSVQQCLQHPYLLTTDEQFNFVKRVGNEREIKTNDVTSVVVKELNADPSLPKPSWKPKIDPEVLKYATNCRRRRPYSDSMADLLRFIRNTAEHWHDKIPPLIVQAKVGKPKEYFLKLFPTLPVVLHRIIRNEFDWNQREQLKQFFL